LSIWLQEKAKDIKGKVITVQNWKNSAVLAWLAL